MITRDFLSQKKRGSETRSTASLFFSSHHSVDSRHPKGKLTEDRREAVDGGEIRAENKKVLALLTEAENHFGKVIVVKMMMMMIIGIDM